MNKNTELKPAKMIRLHGVLQMTTQSEALGKLIEAAKSADRLWNRLAEIETEVARLNDGCSLKPLIKARNECLSMREALALIPIIEGAMLPELPEGWRLSTLDCSILGRCSCIIKRDEQGTIWWNSLYEEYKEVIPLYINGIGPTPRAAVLAAREKVPSLDRKKHVELVRNLVNVAAEEF